MEPHAWRGPEEVREGAGYRGKDVRKGGHE